MLTGAVRDGDVGVGFGYRTYGKLFHLETLPAKPKVMTDIIRDFLLADDCARNAGSKVDMQHSVGNFPDARNKFGFTTGTKKTEVLHQPAPGKSYAEPNVTVLCQNVAIDDVVNTSGLTHGDTLLRTA